MVATASANTSMQSTGRMRVLHVCACVLLALKQAAEALVWKEMEEMTAIADEVGGSQPGLSEEDMAKEANGEPAKCGGSQPGLREENIKNEAQEWQGS